MISLIFSQFLESPWSHSNNWGLNLARSWLPQSPKSPDHQTIIAIQCGHMRPRELLIRARKIFSYMNPTVSSSNCTHPIIIALSSMYSKIRSQAIPMLSYSAKDSPIGVRSEMSYNRMKANRSFLKEGSAKLLAEHPGSVCAKCSRILILLMVARK